MNNAISFAQKTHLQPGIALSAEKVAQLTTDIVWLAQQSVILADGSTQTCWCRNCTWWRVWVTSPAAAVCWRAAMSIFTSTARCN
jgi:hypothetical protein